MKQHEERGSVVYVVVLSLVAALGGLLFGYDTAVISGAIGFLKTRFGLDEIQAGWAASCVLVGCMVGACTAGSLSDWLGRKKILLVAAFLFTVSALGSAVARNLTELVIARLIAGIGVGMASMLSPLYIAEVAPARIRGRLVSANQFAIVFGMLVVYFVNAWIARAGDEAWNVATGWRWMFGSGTFPAIVFLILLAFVPESPRWLTKQRQVDKALTILTRINGPAQARREIAGIEEELAQEGGSRALLLTSAMRKPLLIGIVLAILQQVTGINAVLYYAPEIFKNTGLGATQAISATVLVGAVNLLFTVVAIWVVDRLGRRPLLLIGSVGMGISLSLLGGAFVFQQFEGSWVLILILAYVASFAVAMGPVVWVVLAEIFPTQIRGRAMSVATVCLWLSCFAVSQFFPFLLKHLGGHTFFLYAVMCAVSLVFVLFYVPETKGKSLEEIEQAWRHRPLSPSRPSAGAGLPGPARQEKVAVSSDRMSATAGEHYAGKNVNRD